MEIMLNKNESLDFTGEDIYVGIDVHKKNWKITIETDEIVCRTFNQDPDVKLLSNHLKRNYPNGNYYCAYEAGFSGFWIQQKLEKENINCIVVNPADVPTTDKEKKQKTDKRDSRKIARSLKNGELVGIYVPDKISLEERHLVRSRSMLVRDMTRNKNRIKSLLHFYGINYPEGLKESNKHWSKRFYKWLQEVEFNTEHGKNNMQSLVNYSLHIREMVLSKTREIRQLSKTDKYSKTVGLLCSISGIGPISAMIFATEIQDVRRFKDLDHQCAYVGLIPNMHSSGEKEIIGKMTNRGNIHLKNALIECSWMTIKYDPALLLIFKRLCRKMDKNKAIIRIARKLLNRIRYVLLNNKIYVVGVIK
jgi:transposase